MKPSTYCAGQVCHPAHATPPQESVIDRRKIDGNGMTWMDADGLAGLAMGGGACMTGAANGSPLSAAHQSSFKLPAKSDRESAFFAVIVAGEAANVADVRLLNGDHGASDVGGARNAKHNVKTVIARGNQQTRGNRPCSTSAFMAGPRHSAMGITSMRDKIVCREHVIQQGRTSGSNSLSKQTDVQTRLCRQRPHPSVYPWWQRQYDPPQTAGRLQATENREIIQKTIPKQAASVKRARTDSEG
jgi:hypothetical protein